MEAKPLASHDQELGLRRAQSALTIVRAARRVPGTRGEPQKSPAASGHGW